MKNILILGAGFGGLKTVKILSKKIKGAGLNDKYRVILIDKNHYHTFTPLLYEAATTSKEVANMIELEDITTFQVKKICGNLPLGFVNAEVQKIDIPGKKITLKSDRGVELLDFSPKTFCFAKSSGDSNSQGELDFSPKTFCFAKSSGDSNSQGELDFSHLAIALGSEVNTFGIKGIPEHAFYLKTFLDAMRLRDKIIEKLSDGKKDLKILIGGGGSTGVELAAEIQGWICELKKENSGVKECAAQISIVEGSGSVLSMLHAKIAAKVTKRLKHLGVTIITDEFISEVNGEQICLKSGRILPYDIFVWAGGIKAPKVLTDIEIQKAKSNMPMVQANMRCLASQAGIPATPDLKFNSVYGLGDSVCFMDPRTGRPVPYVARAAIAQGGVVAHNIFEDIKVEEGLSKKRNHKVYLPMEYPYIVPGGGKWAAAKFGPFIISGFLGWVLKCLVELNYFLSVLPTGLAFKTWFKMLRIFIKNDRLG